MKDKAHLTLSESLRHYWPNVLVLALTPTAVSCAMALPCVGWIWPVVFLGMTIFGWVVPHKFGKAPYSYVIVGGLIYFFAGGLLAAGVLSLLSAIGLLDQPSHSN